VHDLNEDARDKEQKYLADLATRLPRPLARHVHYHLLEGFVEETLAAEAATRNIDLVVMSTHGHAPLARVIRGSVTEHLVRCLELPMLLVQPHGQAVNRARPRPFQHMLVPLDGTERSERILTMARLLQGRAETTYRLVRVLPPAVDAEARGHAEAKLEEAARRLGTSNPVHTKVILHANRAVAIQREACTAGCDLIAQATQARTGFLPRLLLGSVADRIASDAATVLSYVARPARPLPELEVAGYLQDLIRHSERNKSFRRNSLTRVTRLLQARGRGRDLN